MLTLALLVTGRGVSATTSSNRLTLMSHLGVVGRRVIFEATLFFTGAPRRSKIGKFCLNLLCLSLDVVSQPRLVLTDTYFDVSSGRGRSSSYL